MNPIDIGGNQGRGNPGDGVEGTLDEPIARYPLFGVLSLVIIAGCMLAIAAAVKGWL